MALVLCLETATKLCSVALCRDGALLAEREAEEDRHVHGEYLNVFVDEVLKEAGLSPKELEAVAVGIGPGSYTGLRIGLSAAKGFCYALDIPILGIGTLETLVQAVRAQEPDLPPDVLLHPMIDARRMEVFTAAYKPDGSLLEPVAAVVLDGTWPNLQPSTSNLQPPTRGDRRRRRQGLRALGQPHGHPAPPRHQAACASPGSAGRSPSRQRRNRRLGLPGACLREGGERDAAREEGSVARQDRQERQQRQVAVHLEERVAL